MNKKLFLRKKTFRFKHFERKKYSAYNSMHKMVTIGVLSVACLLFSVCKTANAQVGDTNSETQIRTLQEISIEDSPMEPVNQTGKVLTIISSQDISNLKCNSVEDLLKFVSGIDVQSRGVNGVQADISIRGGTFDQTAVLLNGINVTNPHTGHYSFDIPITIDDIERIEILKGPSAIVYGASALNGAVNIITKKNVKKSLDLNIQAGEHGLLNTSIAAAKQYKRVENYLSASMSRSDGYTENTAYNMYNVSYQGRINLKHNNKIDIQLGYNNKDYDANTFYSAKYPNQYEQTSGFLASVNTVFNLNKGFSLKALAYYNLHKDKFELIKDVSTPNYHLSDVSGTNLALSYQYKNLKINVGTDLRYEQILSSVLGEQISLHSDHYDHYKDRMNYSFFVSGEYTFNKLLLTGALMTFQNTDISQDNLSLYPSVNLNYSVNEHNQIYVAFSTASRLPSFTELYYKDAVHIPNKDLKQEKSISYEVGIKSLYRFMVVNLNTYFMQGKNLIDWMKTSANDEQWQSRNINQLDKYGVDVDVKIFLKEVIPVFPYNTTLNLAYSLLYQDKAKTDYISQYALNYLKHKFVARLSLPVKDFVFNIAAKYSSREGSYVKYTNNVAGEQVDYEPFFVFDANANYTFGHFTLSLQATNVFDKQYYDIGNIIQPGRWIVGGIRYSL